MPLCQDYHPSWCGEVTWDLLAWDLIGLPASITAAMAFTLWPVHVFWKKKSGWRIVRLIRHTVGDAELKQVHYPKVLMASFLLEIVLSMWFAVSWALRTYTHEVTDEANIIDQTLCMFFMVTYFLNAARFEFQPMFAMRPSSIVTLLTIVPTFSRNKSSSSLWFSFGYLRASNAIIAVNKIEKMGALREMGDISKLYIMLSLRTFALVSILVGTTFALEVLGDPEALEDRYIQTPMGGLSVIQLTYWVFTTISTVGYGDYAPRTVLSRLFVVVSIVVGVCFFTDQINNVVRTYKRERSGRGRYKPTRRGVDHVVLIGGGVRQYSSVMQSLMHELFSFHEERWPDLVIMASAEEPKLLRQSIKSFQHNVRHRIKYLVGDPTEPEDMYRVRMGEANLVIVIPSLLATDLNLEDEANILRTLAVKNAYQSANMRLMLLRGSNRNAAVKVGIPASRCFSVNEQKSGLFALSCACRGLSSLITHFIMSDQNEEDRDPHFKQKCVDPWVHEYREGRKFHLVGFMLNANYAGIPFSRFAIISTKAGVTPIAVQIRGQIMLAPDYNLADGDVVFALTKGIHELKEFSNTKSDWRETFGIRQIDNNAESDQKRRSTTRADSKSLLLCEPESNEEPALGDHKDIKNLKKRVDQKLLFLKAKAVNIANAGGHYILVLLQGSPLHQLEVFLTTLRSDHLPFHVPILILVSPPMRDADQVVAILENFPRIGIAQSEHKVISIHDLRNHGMKNARCIALLAGNAGQATTADRRMIDGSGVTLLSCIEEDFLQCSDLEEPQGVPVFLELHQQESIRFLTRFSSMDAHHSMQDDSYDPKEHFTFHPRFANGNIFTASCFGATVARSFNMPGIVELMEAITLGVNNQQVAFPWQLYLPEGFAGRKYIEIVHHLLESYGAVSVGLFRLCFDDTSMRSIADPRFVFTNPRHNVVLRYTDWLFVFGSAEFGQEFFARGLLVGSKGAPLRNQPETDDEEVMQSVRENRELAHPREIRPEWPEDDELFVSREDPLPHLRTPEPGVKDIRGDCSRHRLATAFSPALPTFGN